MCFVVVCVYGNLLCRELKGNPTHFQVSLNTVSLGCLTVRINSVNTNEQPQIQGSYDSSVYKIQPAAATIM